MVLTMASFAGSPVKMQTFIFQSKPTGRITGSKARPTIARYDFSLCSPLLVASAGKNSKAHIITEEASITVEIFFR